MGRERRKISMLVIITCDCMACTNRAASVPHPNAIKQFSPDCCSHLVSGTIDFLESIVIPYLKTKPISHEYE